MSKDEGKMVQTENKFTVHKDTTSITSKRSDILEELEAREIVEKLVERSVVSSLEEKKRMLKGLVKDRHFIRHQLVSVDKKLALFFDHCIHSTKDKSKDTYKRDLAKTVFRLAVINDIYRKSCSVDTAARDKMNTLFAGVEAAVHDAKTAIRRHRSKQFSLSVQCTIIMLTRDALANSHVLGVSLDKTGLKPGSSEPHKALRRYRALIGVGSDAVSRRQITQIVADLMRFQPGMELSNMAKAVDQILDINQQEQMDNTPEK